MRMAASSIILRARLIAGRPYLGMFLTSVLRRLVADNYALTALPVDLRANAIFIGIVTLKNRVRDVAASLDGNQGRRVSHSSKSKVC